MVTGKCYQSNKKVIIKSVIRVINYARKITVILLMSIMKHLRKSIKLMVNLGMKMNNLRKELLGKVNFNLILIEQ